MRNDCLYEGNGKRVSEGFISPIFEYDNMQIGITYRFLEDITYANATYLMGKKKNPNYTYEDALKQTLKEHIEMVLENTWEEFELCKEKLAKNLASRYEEN